MSRKPQRLRSPARGLGVSDSPSAPLPSPAGRVEIDGDSYFAFVADEPSPPLGGTSSAWSALKDCKLGELVLHSRHYFVVAENAINPQSQIGLAEVSVAVLTPRELQVVLLLAQGRVNKQVAAALRISEWTVSTHIRRIYAKLGVGSRAAMVCRCWGAIQESRGSPSAPGRPPPEGPTRVKQRRETTPLRWPR